MQESPHKREGIDNKHFRVLTGLVGLAALSWIAVEVAETLLLILKNRIPTSPHLIVVVAAPAGWGGLVYACWIRSGRITGTALAFVWALGLCGMVISAIGRDNFHPVAMLALTGTWILTGLGIVWIVHKVRRIRAASNTDTGDAALTGSTIVVIVTALILAAFIGFVDLILSQIIQRVI